MTTKTAVCMVAAVVFSAASVMANVTVTWGSGGVAGSDVFQSNGSTPILAGSLVQLIYLGGDGLYNGFTDSGSGVLGDDVVVSSATVGTGIMGSPAGQWLGSYSNPNAAGTPYIMVFFTDPAVSGNVPTTGNYGKTGVFTTTGDPTQPGATETVTFGNHGLAASYVASTAVAVPEPSTVILMLTGLGLICGRRFRRS